jgi:hypothetical protein
MAVANTGSDSGREKREERLEGDSTARCAVPTPIPPPFSPKDKSKNKSKTKNKNGLRTPAGALRQKPCSPSGSQVRAFESVRQRQSWPTI